MLEIIEKGLRIKRSSMATSGVMGTVLITTSLKGRRYTVDSPFRLWASALSLLGQSLELAIVFTGSCEVNRVPRIYVF